MKPSDSGSTPQAGMAVADFGKVIAGRTLAHTFQYTNTSGQAMQFASGTGLQKMCSCSSIACRIRELSPGETAEIAVVVNTRGKEGFLSEGGGIQWLLADGTRHRTDFRIRANVEEPLRFDPPYLVFNEAEIRAQTRKPVAISSSFPVDWSSLRGTANEGFRVHELEVNKDGATCAIACELPADRASCTGTITFTVKPAATPEDGSRDIYGSHLRVAAKQHVKFRVVPRTLSVRFDSQGKANAKLLLEGAAAADPHSHGLESVEHDACEIRWNLTPASSGAALLHVNFTAREAGVPSTSRLTIKTVDGLSMTIEVTSVAE
jgi:hypothetical protein